MNDSIIELLSLKGDDLIATEVKRIDNILNVSIEKATRKTICPICGGRLYSKGSSIRKLNHPIYQDNTIAILLVKKRKYKCIDCGYFTSDKFSFAQSCKHSTNVVPLIILKEFKDLNATTVGVAKRLNISDTSVHDIFMNSIRLDRLPLSEVISIDEVFINLSYTRKYSLVILDFLTSDPIDILPSRRYRNTEPYFRGIPLEERNRVKYLICDMYNPYINFTKKYFHNAVVVVDCFHVVKWINDKLRVYYNQVKKRYIDENKKNLIQKNKITNKDFETIKDSDELYILKNYDYFLFARKENIDYSEEARKDYFLNQYLNQYQKEKKFFELDHKFKIYRDLKEKYFHFDNEAKNVDNANILLDSLIKEYKECGESIFISFAEILENHKEYIVNSYTYYDVTDTKGNKTRRRLSNGPIESFNNKPKALRRNGHGVNNFEYFRLRILWACRRNPLIRIPSEAETPHHHIGKLRGSYRKQKHK